MKVYISGPMTGRPDYNKPAFMEAEKIIMEMGHDPVNPATLPHDHGRTWGEYMREDIKALMDCEAILMLDGWIDSRGARIEYELAVSLGIEEVQFP